MIINKHFINLPNNIFYTKFVILFFLLPILQACTQSSVQNHSCKVICTEPYKIGAKCYQPILKINKFQQTGIASWYGKKFHGKLTSNGEIYNMHAITAAHKTLPFDCWVRVVNLTNNKWVDVRINDRGPFVEDRIIDLSYAAAQKLDIIKQGIAKVKITYLGEKKLTKKGFVYKQISYKKKSFIIQAGSFIKIKNAQNLRDKLIKDGHKAYITPCKNEQTTNIYRVCIHGLPTLKSTVRYKEILTRDGVENPLILLK